MGTNIFAIIEVVAKNNYSIGIFSPLNKYTS